FGTRFAPDTLQRELSQMLDRQILRPVEFDPMVRFDQGAGQIIRRMLGRLYEEAGNRDLRFTSSLAVWQLERLLISTILEGHKHNYSHIVNGPGRGVAPWQIRIVEEFIAENAGHPLSMGDLAVTAGVTARSLQYSFRRHKGCAPMEFLRQMRLERVHSDLTNAMGDTTVTTVAMRWGFLHLGRFAAEYRAKFGES